MPFLPSTPPKGAPRAVAIKRTTMAPQPPGNTGPLPPGMGTPRPGPTLAQRGAVATAGPRTPMAEGGKVKKGAKKKPGKKK